MENLKYKIALTLIPKVGHIAAKKLIAYCGGAEAVFKDKKQNLLKIPGIGELVAKEISKADVWKEVEKEIVFLEKNEINPLYFLDKNYPQRLIHCPDSPILLYTKGNMDVNATKTISIVGTRKASSRGKANCEKLISDLSKHQPTIVSGLAYGVDICAHKVAVENKLQTIGIMASGMDKIYPSQHQTVAKQMLENGGIATDYRSGTPIHPSQFAERNRIVAGMADAVIVIESAAKGGSLITANLANDYNRDVFAFSGRAEDALSKGCNFLIKTNKAALIESAADIEYIMGWDDAPKNKNKQTNLFVELSEKEQQLTRLMKDGEKTGLDELSLLAKMSVSETTTLLLELEFKGAVRSLPGKIYELT